MSGRVVGRVCWSYGGSGAIQCPFSGLTLPPLCPDQLALDIDRDAEDQNRYLDSMVRVCSVRGHRGQLCPTLPAVQAPSVPAAPACRSWRCPPV